MNTTLVYGILLALGNGLVCISIPALVSYSQRKFKQSEENQEPVTVNSVELLSSEAN